MCVPVCAFLWSQAAAKELSGTQAAALRRLREEDDPFVEQAAADMEAQAAKLVAAQV